MTDKFHAAPDSEGVLQKIETHYLPAEARGEDYDGPIALCDLTAGLTEPDDVPRRATLASAIKSEVTCPDCISHME